MATPVEIAARFEALDAHDDTVEGFFFRPAITRGAAEVSVVLNRHWTRTRREVRFEKCANFEAVVDVDTLAWNAPANTAVLTASTDRHAIEVLIRKHKKSWNASYEKSVDPLARKLSEAHDLVLFRVRLFGGVLLVVARSFSVRRLQGESVA